MSIEDFHWEKGSEKASYQGRYIKLTSIGREEDEYWTEHWPVDRLIKFLDGEEFDHEGFSVMESQARRIMEAKAALTPLIETTLPLRNNLQVKELGDLA